jgi:hypothetical protein
MILLKQGESCEATFSFAKIVNLTLPVEEWPVIEKLKNSLSSLNRHDCN